MQRGYDREFVIDYNSFERNDLMVFSAGYYEQKHIYTAWGERMEQFTERGNYDRLLYVHEDIMGNTRYYTKDNGQSFVELGYDVWGAVTSPEKLNNSDILIGVNFGNSKGALARDITDLLSVDLSNPSSVTISFGKITIRRDSGVWQDE